MQARIVLLLLLLRGGAVVAQDGGNRVGSEAAIERHLQDGEEFQITISDLIEHGRKLFVANWTVQDGGGRPQSKGTGDPLADPKAPLVFPRNFNRISAPDANSCAGCHNIPRIGGGGDVVANVFVLGQRFDSVSFDSSDPLPTKGSADENGQSSRTKCPSIRVRETFRVALNSG